MNDATKIKLDALRLAARMALDAMFEGDESECVCWCGAKKTISKIVDEYHATKRAAENPLNAQYPARDMPCSWRPRRSSCARAKSRACDCVARPKH